MSKLSDYQAKWASQHDWCIETIGNQIIVKNGGWGDIETEGTRIWTGTFKELLEWAGY